MYSTNGGLIKEIILIIIVLLILSYFGISLRNLANSPTTQDNFSYVWNGIVYVWDTYLQVPATYVWDFFLHYIWYPAVHNLENINNNQPTNVTNASPQVPAINVTVN